MTQSDPSDSYLLARFLDFRSQEAFEELVRRHGPMVLGVCRRILGSATDAEDATQAVFLTLVAKAESVRGNASLAGWLYHVACNVAQNARSAAATRRKHEQEVAAMNDARAGARPEDWEAVKAVLDGELNSLPAKYRDAILLHHIQGLPPEAATKQLGCKPSAFSMRLARAREMLRERLTRKGVVVSTVALTGLMSTNAAAETLPTALILSTVKGATAMAAGTAAASAAATPQVAVLVKGAVKAMMIQKAKWVAGIALAAAVGIGGVGSAWFSAVAEEKTPEPLTPPVVAPTPPTAQPAAPSTNDASRAAMAENAALYYGQALLLMQALPKDDLKHAEVEGFDFIDGQTRKTLESLQPAFRLCERGAVLPNCRWGILESDGPVAQMPHLSPLRQLVRLIVIDSKRAFKDKQDIQGVDRILMARQISRHLAVDGALVCYMVHVAMEKRLTDTLATHLPAMSDAAARRLLERWVAGPPRVDMDVVLQNEDRLFFSWFRGLARRLVAAPEAERPAIIAELPTDIGLKEIIAGPGGIEGFARQVDDLSALWEEQRQVMAAPWEKYVGLHKAMELKIQKNTLAKMVLPVLETVRYKEETARIVSELLKAAIEIKLGGDEALKKAQANPDTQAFLWRPWVDGYILESKWVVNGQKVGIPVGGKTEIPPNERRKTVKEMEPAPGDF